MKKFLIALQFLTVLPVRVVSIEEEEFGRALLHFPAVGFLIGLSLSVAAFLLGFLPDAVRAALIIMISVIMTGGIHLDGFADTCDGFYGSRPKEKILEIMRDSRIGVMGVTGIVCLLLLKFTLIASFSQDMLLRILIMMAVFARWVQVLACYMSNYARREGKARCFIECDSGKELFAGFCFTVVLFLLLMKLKGVILVFLSLVPVLLFINYAKRKIGGMTGDTIGAASEIAEVTVLLLALICQR